MMRILYHQRAATRETICGVRKYENIKNVPVKHADSQLTDAKK